MTNVIDQMTAFLAGKGIPCRRKALSEPGFLPGLQIDQGELLIDPSQLKWPGDILHEAAHIALAPPSLRSLLSGKLAISPAEEMAALAWSYAAAVSAGIDPSIVFHEGGYKRGGTQLIEQFSSGLPPGGPGVPMLQWYGLTNDFPRMNSWLRENEDPV